MPGTYGEKYILVSAFMRKNNVYYGILYEKIPMCTTVLQLIDTLYAWLFVCLGQSDVSPSGLK